MKLLIKLEELAIYIITTAFALHVNNNLIIYFLCILIPDISMVGYLINNKVGAYVYNFVHHKAFGITILGIGFLTENEILKYAGLILLAHSSIDRVLGFGLKYSDNFKHTYIN